MRIALAQIDPTVGDLKGNSGLIVRRAKEAQVAGARVVVFPELCICGYPPEDLVLKDYFVADCREALLEIGAACPEVPMVVGVPLCEEGAVYNAAAILHGGERSPAGTRRSGCPTTQSSTRSATSRRATGSSFCRWTT